MISGNTNEQPDKDKDEIRTPSLGDRKRKTGD